MGYKDAASARYISTMLNYKLTDKLFRKEDDYVLEYTPIEGIYYEPKYYVPIIPYALLENNKIPATGWKIVTYARDLDAIFLNTRKMIKGEIDKCGKLVAWLKDFKGKYVQVNGKVY